VIIKVLQVIEREEHRDTSLKNAMIQRGEDPFEEKNLSLFRRYKERMFQHMKDFISKHFEVILEDCIVSEGGTYAVEKLLVKAQVLIDDLTIVLDEVVPCFPPRFSLENHRIPRLLRCHY